MLEESKDIRYHGAGVTDNLSQELNSGSLQEQQMLLTPELTPPDLELTLILLPFLTSTTMPSFHFKHCLDIVSIFSWEKNTLSCVYL